MGDQVPPRGRITQRLLLCNLPCASPGPRDAHQPDTKTRAPVHLVDLHLPHPLPRHPPGALKQQGADGGPHRRARTGVADTGRPPGDAPPLPPAGHLACSLSSSGKGAAPASGRLWGPRFRHGAGLVPEDPGPRTPFPTRSVLPQKRDSQASAFHLGADPQPRQARC